jgi:hypothetical protein
MYKLRIVPHSLHKDNLSINTIMKLHNILKRVIHEGLSSVLYHGTDLHAALQIMKVDKFKLSMAEATSSESGISKKLYYLSTTRSVLGSYHSIHSNVIFKLDGDALGHNYSGNPVDYWGPDFRKINPSKNEMEDRIFTDKPYIENASKYISEIHIKIDDDAKSPTLRKVYMAAKLKNIPVYIYDDGKAFSTLNKRKTIKPTATMMGKGIKPSKRSPDRMPYDAITPYVEVYYAKSTDDLTDKGKRIVNRLIRYSRDAKPSMSADLHNNKSNPDQMEKLMRVWRKAKIRSIDEYNKLMTDKWTTIQKRENEEYRNSLKDRN